MFATLYSLRHRSGTDPGAKVWFIYWLHRYWVSATTVLIRVNLNTLKSYCFVEVRDHICLHISPILYHIYPLANLPSAHQCMPPICPTPYIKFHLQILTCLTNEWTHKKAGLYCPFQYFVPIFNFIQIMESWQNNELSTIFIHALRCMVCSWRTLPVQPYINSSVFQLYSSRYS